MLLQIFGVSIFWKFFDVFIEYSCIRACFRDQIIWSIVDPLNDIIIYFEPHSIPGSNESLESSAKIWKKNKKSKNQKIKKSKNIKKTKNVEKTKMLNNVEQCWKMLKNIES